MKRILKQQRKSIFYLMYVLIIKCHILYFIITAGFLFSYGNKIMNIKKCSMPKTFINLHCKRSRCCFYFWNFNAFSFKLCNYMAYLLSKCCFQNTSYHFWQWYITYSSYHPMGSNYNLLRGFLKHGATNKRAWMTPQWPHCAPLVLCSIQGDTFLLWLRLEFLQLFMSCRLLRHT